MVHAHFWRYTQDGCIATSASYSNYVSVACLACDENQAAAAPLALHNANCEIATGYTKKKNVLRLRLADGAEYLRTAHSHAEMNSWLAKIQFHAGQCRTRLVCLWLCCEPHPFSVLLKRGRCH